jgi:hypothetical protein
VAAFGGDNQSLFFRVARAELAPRPRGGGGRSPAACMLRGCSNSHATTVYRARESTIVKTYHPQGKKCHDSRMDRHATPKLSTRQQPVETACSHRHPCPGEQTQQALSSSSDQFIVQVADDNTSKRTRFCRQSRLRCRRCFRDWSSDRR